LHAAVEAHVAQGANNILVVPLFFGQGGHLKEDLPKLIALARARHPEVSLQITPAAGEVDDVVQLLARWVLQCLDAAVAKT
jgi:sirohydrochlorin cobaltochelatase